MMARTQLPTTGEAAARPSDGLHLDHAAQNLLLSFIIYFVSVAVLRFLMFLIFRLPDLLLCYHVCVDICYSEPRRAGKR